MQDTPRLNNSPQRRPRLPHASSQPAPRTLPPPRNAFEVIVPTHPDLVVLTQTAWTQGGAREQALLARFGRSQRIFIVEPPHMGEIGADRMSSTTSQGVTVFTPHLTVVVAPPTPDERLRLLLNEALRRSEICDFILWYDSPQALRFTKHLFPRIVIWDQTGATPDAGPVAALLSSWADVTLSKGESLAEATRLQLGANEVAETSTSTTTATAAATATAVTVSIRQ